MTPKDKISQTLMQLHANVITWVEAEKIIFPLIEGIKQEAIVGFLVRKLEKTVRLGSEDLSVRLEAMSRFLDKLGG